MSHALLHNILRFDKVYFFYSHQLRIDKILVTAKEEGDSIVAIKQQQQQKKQKVWHLGLFFFCCIFRIILRETAFAVLKRKRRKKVWRKKERGRKILWICWTVLPLSFFLRLVCVEFPLFIRGRSWGKYTKCFAFFFYTLEPTTQKCQKIVLQYPIFSIHGS